MGRVTGSRASYGGQWTIEKLDILETYLEAYTTALKKQPFKLLYLDAFAGTGYVELDRGEDAEFIRGSAQRAINVRDKPFDELIFVEKDQDRCTELESLKNEYPRRNIRIENSDANDFLRGLRKDWRGWRGVLFLDPFATQIHWTTIEAIAGFKALGHLDSLSDVRDRANVADVEKARRYRAEMGGSADECIRQRRLAASVSAISPSVFVRRARFGADGRR